MESNNSYLSFEWIGLENYLKERINVNQKRTRGANFTSADAAVRFELDDGSIQVVLIEWKYTESYSSSSLKISKSGTDRVEIYKPLYLKDNCPLDKSLITDFSDLFYEPFYQLMRQQLLAHEMELAGELGATRVSVLHLTPDKNRDFRRVTSPGLKHFGDSAMDVWKRVVKHDNAFASESIESLFGKFEVEKFPSLTSWWDYITERYEWG